MGSKPNYATVLVANARIILDQKFTKIIRLSSIAKYPFISISRASLDFGTVQIGHSREQELVITNNESVPAKFNIERTSTQPGNQPCMFYISNLTGEIPPKSNYLIKVKKGQKNKELFRRKALCFFSMIFKPCRPWP